MPFPNAQDNPGSAIVVRLTNKEASAFVDPGGGSGGITTLTPLGYQQITGLGTAKALTVPSGATLAVISVEGGSVRYRDDGTDPTTTIGMPLPEAGITYTGSLAAIKFIQAAGTAVLNVLYYR